MLRILCKLSLEPTTCVRRTQNSFGRRRAVTVLIAKFVPGLATLAPPVAGQNGMPFASFLLFDAIGAAAWLSALLGGWALLWRPSSRDPGLLDLVGRFSGALLVLGILGFLLGRIVRRRRILRKLMESRLEPKN